MKSTPEAEKFKNPVSKFEDFMFKVSNVLNHPRSPGISDVVAPPGDSETSVLSPDWEPHVNDCFNHFNVNAN